MRPHRVWHVGLLVLCGALVACSDNADSDVAGPVSTSGYNAQTGRDSATTIDAAIDQQAKPSAELCGNGLDDDGDGQADEDCACTAGATQKCFVGSVAMAGRGSCKKGSQSCVTTGSGEFAKSMWGECAGYGKPSDELCDGVDNDCDGAVDDNCACEEGDEKDCESACGSGKQRCMAGKWKECDAPAPQQEVCGDGVDQDCDGSDLACPGTCTDGVQNQDETSTDCGGICGSRSIDVTFQMNQANNYAPGLSGTERIVSVENTGGSWCAWESSSDCPLSCPSADIAADRQSIHVGGDTKWDDNSGSCSYRIQVCGKP